MYRACKDHADGKPALHYEFKVHTRARVRTCEVPIHARLQGLHQGVQVKQEDQAPVAKTASSANSSCVEPVATPTTPVDCTEDNDGDDDAPKRYKRKGKGHAKRLKL